MNIPTRTPSQSNPVAKHALGQHNAPFYILWRVGGSRPKRKHATADGAFREVSRLRALNPKAVYMIFRCTRVDGGGPPR